MMMTYKAQHLSAEKLARLKSLNGQVVFGDTLPFTVNRLQDVEQVRCRQR